MHEVNAENKKDKISRSKSIGYNKWNYFDLDLHNMN